MGKSGTPHAWSGEVWAKLQQGPSGWRRRTEYGLSAEESLWATPTRRVTWAENSQSMWPGCSSPQKLPSCHRQPLPTKIWRILSLQCRIPILFPSCPSMFRPLSSFCRNGDAYFIMVQELCKVFSFLQLATIQSCFEPQKRCWVLTSANILVTLWGGGVLNKFSWWGGHEPLTNAQDTEFWKQNVSHRTTDVLCWRCGNFNGADLLKDVTGFKSCSFLVLSLLYFVYRDRTSLICRLRSTSPELMQSRTTNRNL